MKNTEMLEANIREYSGIGTEAGKDTRILKISMGEYRKEEVMRIGLVQMDILWEDIEGNKRKAREFFEKAADNQVEILVFPEMSLTGFSMNVEALGDRWREQVDFFKEMSLTYQVTVVFGYIMPVSDREMEQHPDWNSYHNRLAIVTEGKIQLSYAKIHPFSHGFEGNYYQGGEEIAQLAWKDTMLGAFICYDLRFPEIFQISSAKSEIIFVIANWPEKRISHWDALLKARAIENQCYIIGVNRTGFGGKLHYNGHSSIYGPDGERITVLCEEESLIIGDIFCAKVKKLRESFAVKGDRREDLYRKLGKR